MFGDMRLTGVFSLILAVKRPVKQLGFACLFVAGGSGWGQAAIRGKEAVAGVEAGSLADAKGVGHAD